MRSMSSSPTVEMTREGSSLSPVSVALSSISRARRRDASSNVSPRTHESLARTTCSSCSHRVSPSCCSSSVAAAPPSTPAASEEEQQEGETLWEQLEQVVRAKDSCVRGETFEEASLLRAREMELKATLTGDNEDPSRVISTVGEDDIERIVAQWTGIPVEKLSGEDAERVLHLDDILG